MDCGKSACDIHRAEEKSSPKPVIRPYGVLFYTIVTFPVSALYCQARSGNWLRTDAFSPAGLLGHVSVGVTANSRTPITIARLLAARSAGRRVFPKHARCRNRSVGGAADADGALAQRVKHSQFLCHRPSGQSLPKRAFAFENALKVETHGMSLKNCRSNCFQRSVRLYCARIAWKRSASRAPASMN